MIIKHTEQLGYEIDGILIRDYLELTEAVVRQLVLTKDSRITFEYEIKSRIFKSIVAYSSMTNNFSHNYNYCGCTFEGDIQSNEYGYWYSSGSLTNAYQSFKDTAIFLSQKGVTV